MKLGVWIALIAALPGCASLPGSRFDYVALSAEPTPTDWRAGTVWVFTLPERLSPSGPLTYRLTNRPAETCTSGTWYELEPVGAELPRLAEIQLKPAYHTAGRYLVVSLNANMCDMNSEIRGALTGHLFDGEYSTGGISGTTTLGQVQGWRVQ